jgi:hypothetical protein
MADNDFGKPIEPIEQHSASTGSVAKTAVQDPNAQMRNIIKTQSDGSKKTKSNSKINDINPTKPETNIQLILTQVFSFFKQQFNVQNKTFADFSNSLNQKLEKLENQKQSSNVAQHSGTLNNNDVKALSKAFVTEFITHFNPEYLTRLTTSITTLNNKLSEFNEIKTNNTSLNVDVSSTAVKDSDYLILKDEITKLNNNIVLYGDGIQKQLNVNTIIESIEELKTTFTQNTFNNNNIIKNVDLSLKTLNETIIQLKENNLKLSVPNVTQIDSTKLDETLNSFLTNLEKTQNTTFKTFLSEYKTISIDTIRSLNLPIENSENNVSDSTELESTKQIIDNITINSKLSENYISKNTEQLMIINTHLNTYSDIIKNTLLTIQEQKYSFEPTTTIQPELIKKTITVNKEQIDNSPYYLEQQTELIKNLNQTKDITIANLSNLKPEIIAVKDSIYTLIDNNLTKINPNELNINLPQLTIDNNLFKDNLGYIPESTIVNELQIKKEDLLALKPDINSNISPELITDTIIAQTQFLSEQITVSGKNEQPINTETALNSFVTEHPITISDLDNFKTDILSYNTQLNNLNLPYKLTSDNNVDNINVSTKLLNNISESQEVLFNDFKKQQNIITDKTKPISNVNTLSNEAKILNKTEDPLLEILEYFKEFKKAEEEYNLFENIQKLEKIEESLFDIKFSLLGVNGTSIFGNNGNTVETNDYANFENSLNNFQSNSSQGTNKIITEESKVKIDKSLKKSDGFFTTLWDNLRDYDGKHGHAWRQEQRRKKLEGETLTKNEEETNVESTEPEQKEGTEKTLELESDKLKKPSLFQRLFSSSSVKKSDMTENNITVNQNSLNKNNVTNTTSIIKERKLLETQQVSNKVSTNTVTKPDIQTQVNKKNSMHVILNNINLNTANIRELVSRLVISEKNQQETADRNASEMTENVSSSNSNIANTFNTANAKTNQLLTGIAIGSSSEHTELKNIHNALQTQLKNSKARQDMADRNASEMSEANNGLLDAVTSAKGIESKKLLPAILAGTTAQTAGFKRVSYLLSKGFKRSEVGGRRTYSETL